VSADLLNTESPFAFSLMKSDTANLNVSKPLPPVNLSEPAPPAIVSSPIPPTTTSLPSPAFTSVPSLLLIVIVLSA
jgi:hypothetical protein